MFCVSVRFRWFRATKENERSDTPSISPVNGTKTTQPSHIAFVNNIIMGNVYLQFHERLGSQNHTFPFDITRYCLCWHCVDVLWPCFVVVVVLLFFCYCRLFASKNLLWKWSKLTLAAVCLSICFFNLFILLFGFFSIQFDYITNPDYNNADRITRVTRIPLALSVC